MLTTSSKIAATILIVFVIIFFTTIEWADLDSVKLGYCVVFAAVVAGTGLAIMISGGVNKKE